jgi:PAS domain S-box-containing protein
MIEPEARETEDELTDPRLLNADHPVLLMDAATKQLLDVNASGCQLLGYARAELRGSPIATICPAELRPLASWIAEVRDKGQGWSKMFTCRMKDGTVVPMEMQAFAAGRAGRVLVLLRDRSDHRRPDQPNGSRSVRR